jgi:hypothetical protein
VTIVEHNLSLGGVCTAWHRGADLVDGCIHWLTGGPFMEIICAALGRQFRLAPSAIGVQFPRSQRGSASRLAHGTGVA